ncbi:MAG: hypothetical protein PEPC_00894 [Peptostreptococcus russellii]
MCGYRYGLLTTFMDHGDIFLFMGRIIMKLFKTLDEQVNLLKERG